VRDPGAARARHDPEDDALELGLSISTVGNIAANANKKLGVHGAAATVNAHRNAHFLSTARTYTSA
jgi:hypothetical protein